MHPQTRIRNQFSSYDGLEFGTTFYSYDGLEFLTRIRNQFYSYDGLEFGTNFYSYDGTRNMSQTCWTKMTCYDLATDTQLDT